MCSIILFIVVILALKTEQINDSAPVDYIFNVVSETIEDVTIKILNVLQLPPNLVDANAIQKDLDMYSNLKTTTILNYKTFQQIANLTRTSHTICDNDKSNKTSIDHFINEIENATINDEDIQKAIAEEFNYFIPLIIRATDPEDSDNLSLEFIKEFINKINQTELEEFSVDESPNYIRQSKYQFLKLPSEYNLINVVSSESDFTEINDNTTEESNGMYVDDFLRNLTEDKFGIISKIVEDFETQEDSDESKTKNNNDGLFHTENQTINNYFRRMDSWEPDLDSPDYWLQTRRIFDRKPASIKTYPFMVSIFDGNQFVCGGSIIRSNLVLTAASCLQRVYLDRMNVHSETSIYVRFGSAYLASGGYLVHASHIIFHPEFDPVTMNHNLVLLYVRKEDFAKLAWVTKIKYKREESLYGDFKEGKDRVKILGWGHQNGVLDIFSQAGQKISLFSDYFHIFDLEDCQTIYTNLYVTNKNFCAGAHTTSGGACKNDVGGPAIRHGVLLGIVSFGPRDCSAPDKPTVFTKITAYVEWIHDVVKAVVRNIKPLKPVFVYNEDYLRRRSYVHSLPEFRVKKKSKNKLMLKTKKPKILSKYLSENESEKEQLKKKSRKFSKNASPDPVHNFIALETKSKSPLTQNLKKMDDAGPYRTDHTITPIFTAKNVTKALILPTKELSNIRINSFKEKKENTYEEKDDSYEEKEEDEDTGLALEFKPNVLEHSLDISTSSENVIKTTHKKRHKMKTTRTYTSFTEKKLAEISGELNFSHDFDESPIIINNNTRNESESYENDTSLIDMYENDESSPPVAPSAVNLVTPPHSTVGFLLNYYSDVDKDYRNDSDVDEHLYDTYEIGLAEEDYGGLSIEPLGVIAQTTTTGTESTTKFVNISNLVTAFEVNTPTRI